MASSSSSSASTATDALQIVLSRYRLPSFRPGQREVLTAALSGQDALACWPTGGGKSLCFNGLAVLSQSKGASGGLTIVVSPLLALQAEQVSRLVTSGIPAAAYSSSATQTARTALLASLSSAVETRTALPVHALFVAPESLTVTTALQETITLLHNAGRLAAIVVDEAHCIVSFGASFRPAYAKLAMCRDKWPRAPIVALTATATPAVRAEITSQLRLKNAYTSLLSADRPNLAAAIVYDATLRAASSTVEEDVVRRVVGCFSGAGAPAGACIVYRHKQVEVEEISALLLREGLPRGVSCLPYHGGMSLASRQSVEARWAQAAPIVVCATTAFGMGLVRDTGWTPSVLQHP